MTAALVARNQARATIRNGRKASCARWTTNSRSLSRRATAARPLLADRLVCLLMASLPRATASLSLVHAILPPRVGGVLKSLKE